MNSVFSGWNRWAAFASAATVGAGLLVGCAGVDLGGDPTKIVAERAQARWEALVKADLKEAYAFVSPTSRQTYSWEIYRGAVRGGFWKKATVDKVACPSKDSCEVDVTIEYAHRGSQLKTPVRESWVRQDGEWWYVLKSL